jgi:hypothetical protein
MPRGGRVRGGSGFVACELSARAEPCGKCVHDVCVCGSRVGRGAWAFEVRGGHVGAWCARGKTGVSGTAELSVTYRRDKSVDIRDTQIHTFRPVESFVYLQSCFTRQLPISYSSDGEAAQAFTHARAGGVCVGRGCRLRLLELSLRRWRARVRALAMLRLELLPVRHGGKEGLTRLHRRRSRFCRACNTANEVCAVKTVLEASEVAHSVAYSNAENDRSRA